MKYIYGEQELSGRVYKKNWYCTILLNEEMNDWMERTNTEREDFSITNDPLIMMSCPSYQL